jgi:sigma-B regulation protein RsbU (phosphoserine phosphatase)
MPLGLIGNATYTTQSVGFGAGDLLVLYTDGITEAENEQGEEYGLERLIATAVSHRDAKLAALADAVDEDVDCFTNQAPPGDDQTLLLARRSDEV